jgi:flagellar biosynthesis anti-sigma factor FlgM
LVKTMKIPSIKGLFSIARGMLDPREAQKRAQQAGETSKADRVELSSQSQQVQRLTAERTAERGRGEEVARLKAAYERGELQADSAAIAEEMVADGLFDDIIEGK